MEHSDQLEGVCLESGESWHRKLPETPHLIVNLGWPSPGGTRQTV